MIGAPSPEARRAYARLGRILLDAYGEAACLSGYGTTEPWVVGRCGLGYGDIEPDGTLT